MTSGSSAGESYDVLIVGAGLAGIGAAYRLQERCPTKSYAIFEARESIGGTWDQFRYPGVRSDSDMFTLGYAFRPWTGKAIASGSAILEYILETASEAGIDSKVRFDHRVISAEWSSAEARWTVTAERGSGERLTATARFLFVCSGYYRYDQGYLPEFPGIERFGGELIHPQNWPQGAEYDAKRVVVIGSGATAISLVPALAERAATVTMLQRSPAYVFAKPSEDRMARIAQRLLPDRIASALARSKYVLIQQALYAASRRAPNFVRGAFRKGIVRSLPPGYDVDTHFNPRYEPWDQRPCLLPDGDLFAAIANGRAKIVTDRIESFTERGLRLRSGSELEADMVVTATGFNLLFLGGMRLVVDGVEQEPAEALTYKGSMLSGIPNFAYGIGYTHLSWTMKIGLIAEFVCRVLQHMDAEGYAICVPSAPNEGVGAEPVLDSQAGYVMRRANQMPKQGRTAPWRLRQDYPIDAHTMRFKPIEDGVLAFDRGGPPATRG